MGDGMTHAPSSRTAFTASLFSRDLPNGWSLGNIGSILNAAQYGLSEPADASGDTPIVGMRDLSRGTVNLQGLAKVDSGGDDWSNS